MRKPFANETLYDPGRFRFKLSFFQETSVQSVYGGTTAGWTFILTTQAVQEKISSKNQFAIEAGASVLNQDCYFVTRYRSDFEPKKDMAIVCNGFAYLIKAVIPIDVPQRYWKLLCVKSDINLTT